MPPDPAHIVHLEQLPGLLLFYDQFNELVLLFFPTGSQPHSPTDHSFLTEKTLAPQTLDSSLSAQEPDNPNVPSASRLAEEVRSPTPSEASLYSFEINEIYSGCLTLGTDKEEECPGTASSPEGDKANQVDELPSLEEELDKMERELHCFCEEDKSFSEVDTDLSFEDGDWQSDSLSSLSLPEPTREAKGKTSSWSKTDEYVSKCVLNLKISQVMMQQSAEWLRELEQEVDELEWAQKELDSQCRSLWDASLRFANTKFLSAVSPPSLTYLPPVMQLSEPKQPENGGNWLTLARPPGNERDFQEGNFSKKSEKLSACDWNPFTQVSEESMGYCSEPINQVCHMGRRSCLSRILEPVVSCNLHTVPINTCRQLSARSSCLGNKAAMMEFYDRYSL